MRFILEALKGAMIGIANVIPGVSGGTMAVVMGIYDKILMAATNIVKDFKGSVKTLLPWASPGFWNTYSPTFPFLPPSPLPA